jgi:anti-anti-sigma factor
VRNALRADAARPGTTAVVLDAETVPFVDVTAVRMLVELADTLESAGVRFAIAHDIGQVRDLMRGEPATATIPVYPSVAAAVSALGG